MIIGISTKYLNLRYRRIASA